MINLKRRLVSAGEGLEQRDLSGVAGENLVSEAPGPPSLCHSCQLRHRSPKQPETECECLGKAVLQEGFTEEPRSWISYNFHLPRNIFFSPPFKNMESILSWRATRKQATNRPGLPNGLWFPDHPGLKELCPGSLIEVTADVNRNVETVSKQGARRRRRAAAAPGCRAQREKAQTEVG